MSYFSVSYEALDGKTVKIEVTLLDDAHAIWKAIIHAGRYKIGTLELREEKPTQ